MAELLNLIHRSLACEREEPDLSTWKCHTVNSDNTAEWLTYRQAADILVVSKATICRWVKERKLVGNGKRGGQIRLSKTSVLFAKQVMKDLQLRQDVQDLRKDARRTGF